jgi:mono/diheme cytochrome c family protein
MRESLATHPGLRWAELREACRAEHEAYKRGNPTGFTWFANAANGFAGVPYLLLRVLPELAPEIWGRPEDDFDRFGLFRDPDEPKRPLPRGLGLASTARRPVGADGNPTGQLDFAQPGLHLVSLACGACHTGRVQVGSRMEAVEGGANTQFDVRKWREAFSQTVAAYLDDVVQITSTAQIISALIDQKPDGYFYPADYFGSAPGYANFSVAVEASQQAAVKANLNQILTTLAVGTKVRGTGVDLQLRTSYGNWNAPGLSGYSTGQQDGSGDLIAQLLAQGAAAGGSWDPVGFLGTTFPEMPPFATNTDIPSVWNQQARKVGQWDGSVRMPFWRNLAAQLPIVGQADKVDLHNTGIVANFLHGLPPVPYPFEVDMTRAARGEALFDENCSACHKPLNDAVYGRRDIGTDMNRAEVLNGPARELFLAGFTASCHEPDFRHTDPAGDAVLPCRMDGADIIADRTRPDAQGYVASVLDGIWARAPYLHNGSIPTLRHLLTPGERPATFLRGAVSYDTSNVGWTWDVAEIGRVGDTSPTLMLFDTRRDGAANVGHDRDVVVDGKLRRLDWSGPGNAEAVLDLIEYLKTR